MSGRTQPDAGAAHDRFARKADKRVGVPLSPLCAKTGREHMQQTALLFDHLVGAGEQRRRHGEAERLRSLEVDHQFQVSGKFDRQIARRHPVQDFMHVIGRAAEARAKIDSIANQPAVVDMFPISVDGGKPCRGGERCNSWRSLSSIEV
jgi:hypothetical protein